ncbi:MAG TPA: DUF1573 domain-containing protein [Cytophagaceae bacterium]|jgi:hypothetical protein|nr:DUF1573 domain-containing protein [Cytophagaceae bacterium]
MKKALVFTFLFFVACTGLSHAQAAFSFEQTAHDFGVVKPGKDTLWYDFVFVNKGIDPLEITSVKTSCDCTLAKWPKTPIQPGKKATIKGGFKIEGKTGPFDKSIIIIANTSPATTFLTLTGDVK